MIRKIILLFLCHISLYKVFAQNTVSAYSSINGNADSITVMLINRDMASSRTVTINLSNFTVAYGNYKTLQLSSLPATETFISDKENSSGNRILNWDVAFESKK